MKQREKAEYWKLNEIAEWKPLVLGEERTQKISVTGRLDPWSSLKSMDAGRKDLSQ